MAKKGYSEEQVLRGLRQAEGVGQVTGARLDGGAWRNAGDDGEAEAGSPGSVWLYAARGTFGDPHRLQGNCQGARSKDRWRSLFWILGGLFTSTVLNLLVLPGLALRYVRRPVTDSSL